MSVIKVTSEHQYDVVIGKPWLSELITSLPDYSRVAIFFSENQRKYIPEVSTPAEVHYFPLPDGEGAKSSQTLAKMWDWMGAAGFTRSDVVIAVGGGTITDAAGFLSATWMRGIDWIAVPTTLAGMVDASVGGKTGINSEYGKNLIGAISDASILDLMKEFHLDRDRENLELLTQLIEKSVSVKAQVVSTDFRESFEREILNYGHTLGHAIERHSKYTLRHGEAISIGLVFAAHLSSIHCSLSSDVVQQHIDLLSKIGLPTSYDREAFAQLHALMSIDKKSRGNSLRFVGLSEVGKTQRIEGLKMEDIALVYEKIAK
ncbi:MAG: 3-dehydroquinate synthase [Actinobacteria bacterium]|nr:3-dehydroquinate synthase [Actinomycetota bacterium]